jgi:fatty-acyl-CoA synthase
VKAAAAFGIPDETWGERLEAALVLTDPAATSESIEAAARAGLPDFKIPKRWHIVSELPMGPTGKVDRQALVDMATAAGDSEPEAGSG